MNTLHKLYLQLQLALCGFAIQWFGAAYDTVLSATRAAGRLAGCVEERIDQALMRRRMRLRSRLATLPADQPTLPSGDRVLSIVLLVAAGFCCTVIWGDLQAAYAEHLAQQFAATEARK